MKVSKTGLMGLGMLAVAAAAGPAAAQQAENPPPRNRVSEDDVIVVTAQRREQAVLDVPIAVTAFDAEAIRDLDIQGHSQLSYLTPGLLVQEQSPQRAGYMMRGLTAEVTDAFSEPQISIYNDGIDTSRQSGSILEFVDVGRVEVVKGPQGTLFGRGASIGAISVYSARPDLDDAFGSATLEYGNYDYLSATIVGNAPLIDGVLGVRGAFRTKTRDGMVDNVAGPIDELMGRDTQFGRVSFRYQPNAAWTSDLIIQGQQDDPGPTQFKSISIPPAGGDTSPFTPSAQDRPDQALTRRVFSVVWDNAFEVNADWSLQSLSGYREIDALERWDGDGTAIAFIIGDQDTQQWQVSQEFRASWQPEGPVSAFFGVSVFHEEIEDLIAFGLNEQYVLNGFNLNAPPVTMFPVGPGVTLPVTTMNVSSRYQRNTRDSYALFADVSWDLTEKLTLEAGLRYQLDQGESSAATTVETLDGVSPIALPNGALGGNSNGVFYAQSDDFELITPRLVLSYALTDRTNIYAGVARGARSGSVGVSINSSGVGVRDILDPEYVLNYEIGAKSLLPIGLLAEIALYHFEYTDFITTDPDPSIGRVNAGEASAFGLEASLSGHVSDNLSLYATYSHHDGQYDNFATSAGDLSGNRFRLAPENTFSFAANYERPLANGYSLRLQGTYAYRGQHFFNDDNLPNEQQDAYSIVNGAFGLHAPEDRWFVELWGNNIFDEEYVIDIGNTGKSFGGLSTSIRGEPRFYGLRVGANF